MSEVLVSLPESSAAANLPALAAPTGYFQLQLYSVLWLGCTETGWPSVTVTCNVTVMLPGLSASAGRNVYQATRTRGYSRGQYGATLRAPAGLPRCPGSPRHDTSLKAPATAGVLSQPFSVTPKMQTVILRWSCPSQQGLQIRAMSNELSLLLLLPCHCCLCLCPPGQGALLRETCASSQVTSDKKSDKKKEPRSRWQVMKWSLRCCSPVIYQKNCDTSLFCPLMFSLRWQFGHKSAISTASSLQSCCLFLTPLSQANIQ